MPTVRIPLAEFLEVYAHRAPVGEPFWLRRSILSRLALTYNLDESHLIDCIYNMNFNIETKL